MVPGLFPTELGSLCAGLAEGEHCQAKGWDLLGSGRVLLALLCFFLTIFPLAPVVAYSKAQLGLKRAAGRPAPLCTHPEVQLEGQGT